MLLDTYGVLGVEAGAVHHQQLDHLKSIDSHCVVHRCVSILVRILAGHKPLWFILLLFLCGVFSTIHFLKYFSNFNYNHHFNH